MPEAVAHFAAGVRPHTKLTHANGTQEKEYTPVVQNPDPEMDACFRLRMADDLRWSPH